MQGLPTPSLSKFELCKALIGCCAVSTVVTTLFSPSAVAQSFLPADAIALPSSVSLPLDSSSFSQNTTDAVTQGFRNRDRNFFEDGIEQFEHSIEALQQGEQPAPILTVEPTPDSWQRFFEEGTVEPN